VWVTYSAAVLLVIYLALLCWSLFCLACQPYRFGGRKFYGCWNTFVFEKNSKLKRPPLYNFWNLLRCIGYAVWIAFWWDSMSYNWKIIPIICCQAAMIFYNFFFHPWALGIQWWIVNFNEVCIMLAAILCLFLPFTSVDDIDSWPIIYIALVLLNYTVNVARGLLDLFGAFFKRHSIFALQNGPGGTKVKHMRTVYDQHYNTAVKPRSYQYERGTPDITNTELVNVDATKSKWRTQRPDWSENIVRGGPKEHAKVTHHLEKVATDISDVPGKSFNPLR